MVIELVLPKISHYLLFTNIYLIICSFILSCSFFPSTYWWLDVSIVPHHLICYWNPSSSSSDDFILVLDPFATWHDDIIATCFIHQFFHNYCINYPAIMLLISPRVIMTLAFLLLDITRQPIHLHLRFEVNFRTLNSIVTQLSTSVTTAYVLLVCQYHPILYFAEFVVLDWVQP